jgi:hypothetical protein
METNTVIPRPATGRRRTATDRLRLAGLAWSLTCAGVVTWWLFDPASVPLPSETPVSLLGYLGPRAGAALCLAFAVIGVLVAAVPARGEVSSRVVVGAGAAVALFFGVVAPDIQLLSVLGYSMALLGGPVVVALLVAGACRHRANLVVLALIGAAVAAGVLTGDIGEPTLEMLRQIRDGFVRIGIRPLVVAFLAAGGFLLGAITLAAARARSGSASRERLARWGRVATVVAALGPVPYGMVRLTWATPWPQGLGPGDESMLDGGIRVFGLCLGLAALSGAWLTIGLVRPWDRVWPRWVPGLRGRPVPVLAAVVPASLVATALCGAAVSIAVMAVQADGPGLLLFIPAPIWGPALLMATYAYHRERTDVPSRDPADVLEVAP